MKIEGVRGIGIDKNGFKMSGKGEVQKKKAKDVKKNGG